MRMIGLESLRRSEWLTMETHPLVFVLNVNYHFTVIPILAYGIWKYGYDRRALLGAIVFSIAITVGTRLFTPVTFNINCMFYSCDVIYRDLGTKDQGWLYTIWRCGYFIFFSGIIHLIILWLKPNFQESRAS